MSITSIFCPGSVFGFWFNWGVLVGMKPKCVLTCVSGSTIASVMYVCGLQLDAQLIFLKHVRRMVFTGNLLSVVECWLREVLPSNVHKLCNKKVAIVLRHVPSFKLVKVSSWRDREHLILSLLAACSWVPRRVDNYYAMDAFWYRESNSIPNRFIIYPPTEAVARRLYADGLRHGKDAVLPRDRD